MSRFSSRSPSPRKSEEQENFSLDLSNYKEMNRMSLVIQQDKDVAAGARVQGRSHKDAISSTTVQYLNER